MSSTVSDPTGELTPAERPPVRSGLVLGRRALETFAFRIAVLPLGFVVTLITSRFLLPEGRGAFTLALLTVTIASTVLGNGTAITHEIGRRTSPVQDIVVRGLVLNLVLSLGAAAVLVPLGVFREGLGAGHLMMLGLPLLLVSQTLGGALVGQGRLRLYNLVQLIDSAVIVAGLTILVAWRDYGLEGAVVSWLAGQVVSTGVLLAAATDLWLPVPRSAFSPGRLRPIFTLGAKAGLVSLVSMINYRVELFLLEAFEGLAEVGIYSVAMSLAELLWLLSWTIQTVVVDPAVNEEEERAVSVVAQGVRQSVLLTGIAAIGLAVVGAATIPLVFGEPFRDSIMPLLILLPGVVIFSVRSPLSVFFSMRMGSLRYPLGAAGASAIATTLLCLVLIPAFAAEGAALATTIGYGLGTATLVVMFLRVSRTSVRSLVPAWSDLVSYRELARSLVARA